MEPPFYPGAFATPEQLVDLAGEYSRAAQALLNRAGGRRRNNSAPARLCALHAIELYLNAFLLRSGRDPAEIRGLQHNLGARAEMASGIGLHLRRRTLEHLRQLSNNREYLAVRYSTNRCTIDSQINRLTATLGEIADKTVPPQNRQVLTLAADIGTNRR